jgi:hypothetical protein
MERDSGRVVAEVLLIRDGVVELLASIPSQVEMI